MDLRPPSDVSIHSKPLDRNPDPLRNYSVTFPSSLSRCNVPLLMAGKRDPALSSSS
ncbi:uncharacterized protein J3R85_005106 [Psidium guajava]|nr:uncharacterized protein J3R85_005106 [Psidium guajava]